MSHQLQTGVVRERFVNGDEAWLLCRGIKSILQSDEAEVVSVYPIRDGAGFDPEAMLRFYRRPDWPTVLKLFANIDEDEETVVRQVAAIIREFAVSHGETAGGDAHGRARHL